MAMNILLVDDSITVRAVVKKALQLAEVPFDRIFQAGNGAEALEIIGREHVDLVISDIVMPEMDGEQMVVQMAEEGLLGKIPVIIVSSAGGGQRLQRLEALGVSGFIHKPFTPEQIRETVDQVTKVGT